MGWDAFGLPTEQYAIKTGKHPKITTTENVSRFKEQLKQIGLCYDWEREVNTTDLNISNGLSGSSPNCLKRISLCRRKARLVLS